MTLSILAEVESPYNSAVAGAIAGIITFVVSRLIYDFVENWRRRCRLIRALQIDCLATLNKFTEDSELLKCFLSVNDTGESSLGPDLLKNMYCGVIVSEPILETRELILLLPIEYSRNLVHYFDRWGRFVALEKKYAELHGTLLKAYSAIKNKSPDAAYYSDVLDEMWIQFKTLSSEMGKSGFELCFYACRLFETTVGSIRCDWCIREKSCGRWKSWHLFQEEMKTYIK